MYSEEFLIKYSMWRTSAMPSEARTIVRVNVGNKELTEKRLIEYFSRYVFVKS